MPFDANAFIADFDKHINRLQSEINAKCTKISIELFLQIVKRSPSKFNPGPYAEGLLINQWYPKVGTGFSNELTDIKSHSGAGSNGRIVALRGGTEFLGKDGRISLVNNLDYAYRAEQLGWPAPEWSGESGSDGAGGPFKMVALSLQEIAARYK